MHNGVKDENGAIVGKISDTTAGIYLRCCRAVWNRCVHEGYLKDVPYPFSNKKEKRLVSIPKSAKRKQSFLNVNQMTELYDLLFQRSILNIGRKNIPNVPTTHWDCFLLNTYATVSTWLMLAA